MTAPPVAMAVKVAPDAIITASSGRVAKAPDEDSSAVDDPSTTTAVVPMALTVCPSNVAAAPGCKVNVDEASATTIALPVATAVKVAPEAVITAEGDPPPSEAAGVKGCPFTYTVPLLPTLIVWDPYVAAEPTGTVTVDEPPAITIELPVCMAVKVWPPAVYTSDVGPASAGTGTGTAAIVDEPTTSCVELLPVCRTTVCAVEPEPTTTVAPGVSVCEPYWYCPAEF